MILEPLKIILCGSDRVGTFGQIQRKKTDQDQEIPK